MAATRRRFLSASAGSVALLSGCTVFGEDGSAIVALEVELSNSTEEAQVFHFVLEATDGLGEWQRYELEEDTVETVVLEPDQDREYVALHGVVNDHHVFTELYGFGSGEVCPRVLFTAEFDLHVDNEPLLALTTQTEC